MLGTKTGTFNESKSIMSGLTVLAQAFSEGNEEGLAGKQQQRIASPLAMVALADGTQQKQGETTLAFSHRLRSIFDSVQSRQRETEVVVVSGQLLRDHFAENLHDPFLRRQLRERIATDPEVPFLGLREQAIRWDQDKEGYWTGATNQVAAKPAADTAAQQQALAAIQSLTEQVAKLAGLVVSGQSQAPSAEPARKQPIICYSCRDKGHIARHCPKKKAGNDKQLQK